MTGSAVSDADFAKLQKMAKLTLSDEEKAKVHAQLDEALKAIEVFDELDLAGVPPMTHPTGLENVVREDVVTPSFTEEQALQNAPATHAGYIMVPGVFEEQA